MKSFDEKSGMLIEPVEMVINGKKVIVRRLHYKPSKIIQNKSDEGTKKIALEARYAGGILLAGLLAILAKDDQYVTILPRLCVDYLDEGKAENFGKQDFNDRNIRFSAWYFLLDCLATPKRPPWEDPIDPGLLPLGEIKLHKP